MGPEKDIVTWWLNRNGFFTITSIKVEQNKGIGILAVKMGAEPAIKHIEISCSVSAISNLTLDKSSIEDSVNKFVNRRFNDKAIVRTAEKSIKELTGKKLAYEKILVLGAMARQNRGKTISALNKNQIRVYRFENILFELVKTLDKQNYRNPTIRNLQLVKFLLLADPATLAQLLETQDDASVLNTSTKEVFLKELLSQPGSQKMLQKESNEKILIEILKKSSLKRPARLAKVLREEILSKRAGKNFSREIAKGTVKKESKAIPARKETPLFKFFKMQ